MNMNPERIVPIARGITIAVVLLALVGLVVWYVYIGSRQQNIEEVSVGRGFGGGIPTFEAPGGSTFGNLLGALPAQDGETADARTRPRLSQIHAAPVAGFRVSSTTVQYMDRSGYLYTADLATEMVVRTTNTLIPRVAQVWLDDTGIVGFVYDEGGELSAFAGTLDTSTTTGALPTIMTRSLGNSVLAAGNVGSALLTLIEEPSGGASLIESAFDSTEPQLRARSAIRSWDIAAVTGRVALIEKSGSGIPASAYVVEDGALQPFIQDVPGLTLALRPSSDTYLYGADAGSVSLFAVHGTTTNVVPLRTIADKCAWSPIETENPLAYCATPTALQTNTFLDSWYRGELLTRDGWWRVDATDGSAQPVFAADSVEITFDVYNPHVDPSGTYIVFQNKYDETLWALRITE